MTYYQLGSALFQSVREEGWLARSWWASGCIDGATNGGVMFWTLQPGLSSIALKSTSCSNKEPKIRQHNYHGTEKKHFNLNSDLIALNVNIISPCHGNAAPPIHVLQVASDRPKKSRNQSGKNSIAGLNILSWAVHIRRELRGYLFVIWCCQVVTSSCTFMGV